MSPARQPTQQTLTENMKKLSSCGSVSSFNDTDDEGDSTYSKSDTMAKVDQLIRSRNLRRTSSKGEQQPMASEEMEDCHLRAGSLSQSSSRERQRKVGLGPQIPLSQAVPLSVMEGRTADDRMGDDLVSGVVASLREQVEARQREFEKWETRHQGEHDSSLGLNVQCSDDRSCSSYCQQIHFSTNATAPDAERDELSGDEPIRDDEKMKTEESGGKSVSRAQKLRHSIMSKLRRVSGSVEGDKTGGASKRLEVECAESSGKLEKELVHPLAEGSVGKKKKKRKKVIRVVKQVVKRKIPKRASPETGISADVCAGEAQIEEKTKAATPREGLSRLMRKLSFGRGSRSRPGVAEKSNASDDQGCQVGDKHTRQEDGSGTAGIENKSADTEIINEKLMKTPIEAESVPDSELTGDQPRPLLLDLAMDGKELDTSVVAVVESLEHQPQSDDMFGEKTAAVQKSALVLPRTEKFSCEVNEALMRYPTESTFVGSHANKEVENENQRHCQESAMDDVKTGSELTCEVNDHGLLITGSNILVKSQPLKSDSISLDGEKSAEFATKPSSHSNEKKRFGIWESQKKVSVRERVQMYQGQKGTTKEDVGKSSDNWKCSSVHRERSDSFTSLKEKYEKSGRSATETPIRGVRTLKETATEPSPSLKQKTAFKPYFDGNKFQCADGQAEVPLGISSCQQAESNLVMNTGREMVSSVNMNSSRGEARETSLDAVPTNASSYGNSHGEHQNVSFPVVQKQSPIHQSYSGSDAGLGIVATNSGGLSHLGQDNSAPNAIYSNEKHRDVVRSVIGDHQSNARHEISSASVTPETTPEREEVNHVGKLRQLWMSREGSENTVSESKSRDCTPPKAHFRDSWKTVETSTGMKRESHRASGVCESVLSLKKGSSTVSHCQGWYRKQTGNAGGRSTKTSQGRNREPSLNVMSDGKPSETVEINSSGGKVRTDISGSSDSIGEIAGAVGTNTELSERAKSTQGPMVPSGTSFRQVEVGKKHFVRGHQNTFNETVHPSSVSQKLFKGMESFTSKSCVKVSSGAVPAHIVQWQTKCETSHKGSCSNGLSNPRKELGHPAKELKNVSVPQISIVKQSTSDGKSGTRIRMSFSVQKP